MTTGLHARMRRYPAFFAGMGVATALTLALAVALGRDYGEWRRAGQALEQGQRELVAASAAANGAAAVEAEALRGERGRVMAELFGSESAAVLGGGLPAGRIEAYADLVAFVERHRVRAAQAGVAVAADERFGFGRYSREGPALDAVAAVWRQRVELDDVLDALWAARPESLTGVWCGEDEAAGTPSGRSLGVAGLVESRRCRLAFVSETPCLRQYLPALAGLARPVVVREVRAEPMPVDERRPGAPPGLRFTLRLELLSPAGPVAAPEVAVAAGATVPLWPAPLAQSTGAGWCFEVFGAPMMEYRKDRREWVLVGGAAGPATRQNAEVELVEVRRLPYRWRLVGHGGKSDDEGWVVLEDTRAGRTARLRRGERDEEGAITLQEWRLVRAPGGEQVVEAKLLGRDAAERWLRAGVPAPGSEFAVVLREGGLGALVEGLTGATVRVGPSEFRIGAIEENPASVEITRLVNRSGASETLRLRQPDR